MSVNGIGGLMTPLLRPQDAIRPRVEQERPAQVTTPTPATVARPTGTGLLAPRQEGLPLEAPAGTDPELWQVLTAQERAYFAKTVTMGPLTYGRPSRPTTAGETPLVRGGRIDVKA
jgi:hypothetical protein